MYSTLKRILIGPPIASTEEHHPRLLKMVALAVFASDAISSTAYATEEILLVLVPSRWPPSTTWSRSRHRHRAAGHRRHQLPPDDPRLPERRRLLRRLRENLGRKPRSWPGRRCSSTTR